MESKVGKVFDTSVGRGARGKHAGFAREEALRVMFF